MRKYLLQGIIITGLVLFSRWQGYAQLQPKDSIENQFNIYRENNLQEKIFVHTDKGNYLAGEICWFKIYDVDACFHMPIDLGKVAYVEILDKNNKAILQAKIALEKGLGDGSFFLPVSIPSGNYKLRAYTNWMKNFGADYFFEKKLDIYNVQKAQQEKTAAPKTGYDIAFFPEGGNLVNGIKSKVGFRITNSQGKGAYGEGAILNEKGDTITKFHPLKFGIGNFSFTPHAGSNYRAIVMFPGNGQQVRQLPAAYSNGYAMKLERDTEGQIKITVETSGKDNLTSPVFLFVHTRNIVKTVMANTLKNGRAEFILDTAKLGEGISHFTVFNETRQPVCERLFFKAPVKGLKVTASTDMASYDVRKKINISIGSKTEEGKSNPANMSMAVYKVDEFTSVEEQAINNYLSLEADLAGTVESPDFYFMSNNDTAAMAMDNLLLTQGWRRFKWDDVLSNPKPAFRFVPEINGHIITGRITALQPGLPITNVKAYLSVPGSYTQFQTAGADDEGTLKFEMKNFFGGSDIVIQTNNEKDSGYRIDIEQPFFKGFSERALPPFDSLTQKQALLKTYIATQVQNTFLNDKLNQPSLILPDTNAFYLKPDGVYLLDNYVRFTTLEEVLREYVFEVNVRKHNGSFLLPVFDEVSKTPFNTNPLVLMDGVPIFDFNKLMSYDPLKIRKLEVVAREYYLGSNSFDGIVNFTTYKGDVGGYEIDPRATIMDYEGLQLQRDFYAPAYETSEKLSSRMPDFRRLLYWSPNIKTDSAGKAKTALYSSDLPGRYAIVLQGIASDGRAGSSISYFEVKKR